MFKPGDKVRLKPDDFVPEQGYANNGRARRLLIRLQNREFFIVETIVDEKWLCVEGCTVKLHHSRFELVKDSKFKVGDIVRCIDNQYATGSLKLGVFYTVGRAIYDDNGKDGTLLLNEACGGFRSNRFEKVADAEPAIVAERLYSAHNIDDLKKQQSEEVKVMQEKEFRQIAIDAVVDYFNSQVDSTDKNGKITADQVFIVWMAKVLQNNKCLLSTTVPDGMYYEFTWNGDRNEGYLDAYKKWRNVLFKGV